MKIKDNKCMCNKCKFYFPFYQVFKLDNKVYKSKSIYDNDFLCVSCFNEEKEKVDYNARQTSKYN